MKTAIQINSDSKDPVFRTLCREAAGLMKKAPVPGAALGIFHKGREHFAGLGVTSIAHPLPVTPDTLFQIGSISKTFLAAIVLMLAEKGKLNLDAPVRRYLPGLKLKDKAVARRVTMRHLLTHTGGWDGDLFVDHGRGADALRKMTENLHGLKQLAPLGNFWSYNNSGFYIGGRVVEVITGKPYETAAKEMLFDPLGMKNSFFFSEEVIMRRFAVGHEIMKKRLKVAQKWDIGRSSYPAGGILCSARDLMRYGRFHLDGCRLPNGKRLLSARTVKEFHTEIMPATGFKGIALSWFTASPGGARFISHGGATHGQKAELTICLEKKYVALALTNSDRGKMVIYPVLDKALSGYLGIEVKAPKLIAAPANVKEYVGVYMHPLAHYAVSKSPNGLTVNARLTDAKQQKAYGSFPAIVLRFYEKDKVVAINREDRGAYGEFLRDGKGKVRWLRLFLRVLPKKK
jgi:CubicO group peptidase (beta-lactamase class C family)